MLCCIKPRRPAPANVYSPHLEPLEDRLVPAVVTDFGAKPNDGIDDTKAIQACIDSVAAQGGGQVIIPAGTYILSIDPQNRFQPALNLRSNIVMQGAGINDTVLKLADNQGPYRSMLTNRDPLVNFTLRDLSIDANAAHNPLSGNTMAAIENQLFQQYHSYTPVMLEGNVSQIVVERTGFHNINGGWALFVGNDFENSAVHDITIQNNTFDGVGGFASADYDHSSLYGSGVRFTVSGNTFATKNGAGSNGGRTAIEMHGSDHAVTDNVIQGYLNGILAVGIGAYGSNQLYARNTILNAAEGIQLWSYTANPFQQIVIRDNKITVDIAGWDNFFETGGRHGIAWENNGNANIGKLDIINNDISFVSNGLTLPDNFSQWNSNGINLRKYLNPNQTLNDIRILNNRVQGSPGPGILVQAGMNRAEIAGNRITDAGKANFLDVSQRVGLWIGKLDANTLFNNVSIHDNTTVDTAGTPTIQSALYETVNPEAGKSSQLFTFRNTTLDKNGNTLNVPGMKGTSASFWNLTALPSVGLQANPQLGFNSVSIPVVLNAPSLQPITVAYTVSSTHPLTTGDVQLAQGTITFLPGQTLQTLNIVLPGSTLTAAKRELEIRLAWPQGSTVGTQHSVNVVLPSAPLGEAVAGLTIQAPAAPTPPGRDHPPQQRKQPAVPQRIRAKQHRRSR